MNIARGSIFRRSPKIAKLSDGDHKHAMYVVKNYEDKVGPDHLIAAEMHDEDKDNSWYSPEGEQAGANSDVNQLWGPEKSPLADVGAQQLA